MSLGVADDHGDGHGFADGAGKAEDDGAEDAQFGEAQDEARGLPPGGAQTQGALFEFGRGDGQDIADDRR